MMEDNKRISHAIDEPKFTEEQLNEFRDGWLSKYTKIRYREPLLNTEPPPKLKADNKETTVPSIPGAALSGIINPATGYLYSGLASFHDWSNRPLGPRIPQQQNGPGEHQAQVNANNLAQTAPNNQQTQQIQVQGGPQPQALQAVPELRRSTRFKKPSAKQILIEDEPIKLANLEKDTLKSNIIIGSHVKNLVDGITKTKELQGQLDKIAKNYSTGINVHKLLLNNQQGEAQKLLEQIKTQTGFTNAQDAINHSIVQYADLSKLAKLPKIPEYTEYMPIANEFDRQPKNQEDIRKLQLSTTTNNLKVPIDAIEATRKHFNATSPDSFTVDDILKRHSMLNEENGFLRNLYLKNHEEEVMYRDIAAILKSTGYEVYSKLSNLNLSINFDGISDDTRQLIEISMVMALGAYLAKTAIKLISYPINEALQSLNIARTICAELVLRGEIPSTIYKYLLTYAKLFLSKFFRAPRAIPHTGEINNDVGPDGPPGPGGGGSGSANFPKPKPKPPPAPPGGPPGPQGPQPPSQGSTVVPSAPPAILPSAPPAILPSAPPAILPSAPPAILPSAPPAILPSAPSAPVVPSAPLEDPRNRPEYVYNENNHVPRPETTIITPALNNDTRQARVDTSQPLVPPNGVYELAPRHYRDLTTIIDEIAGTVVMDQATYETRTREAINRSQEGRYEIVQGRTDLIQNLGRQEEEGDQIVANHEDFNGAMQAVLQSQSTENTIASLMTDGLLNQNSQNDSAGGIASTAAALMPEAIANVDEIREEQVEDEKTENEENLTAEQKKALRKKKKLEEKQKKNLINKNTKITFVEGTQNMTTPVTDSIRRNLVQANSYIPYTGPAPPSTQNNQQVPPWIGRVGNAAIQTAITVGAVTSVAAPLINYITQTPDLANQPFARSSISNNPLVESTSERIENALSTFVQPSNTTLPNTQLANNLQNNFNNQPHNMPTRTLEDNAIVPDSTSNFLRNLATGAAGAAVIAQRILSGQKAYQGGGISSKVDNHEENAKIFSKHYHDTDNYLKSIFPKRAKVADLFRQHFVKQKEYKPLKYEKKPAKGCGICGGNMDLMVHDKDVNDYTCKPCFDKEKMTAGRFLSRHTKLYPISESKHPQHIEDDKQHKVNSFLLALDNEKPKTKFQEFDESARIPKDWITRYSQDYVMDRPHLKKDKEKMTYLLGMREHAPEFMSTPLKANLQKMIFNHLKNEKPKPSIPDLHKFNTYDEIHHQVTHGSGFLHHYIV